MAFCSKCGAHIPDDAQFCNNCGTEVKKNNVDFSQFKNTSDYTATIDKADMNSNKAMAIISYLGFLFLIPLFAAKNSRFAQFHVKQGLVLFIFEIIIAIAASIITAISRVLFSVFLWPIAIILGIIAGILSILPLPFIIIGIVNAATGRAKELPLIGHFAQHFTF